MIFAASDKMPEPKDGQDITLRIAFMVNNKPDLRIISVNTPLKSIIQVCAFTEIHWYWVPDILIFGQLIE